MLPDSDRSVVPAFWLAGHGAWPAGTRAASLIRAIRGRGVTRLVDIRLSPCSSDPVEGRPYGPKPWNLQAGGAGLVALLDEAGVAYDWLVELGNPSGEIRTWPSSGRTWPTPRRLAGPSRPGMAGRADPTAP